MALNDLCYLSQFCIASLRGEVKVDVPKDSILWLQLELTVQGIAVMFIKDISEVFFLGTEINFDLVRVDYILFKECSLQDFFLEEFPSSLLQD